jgi:sporulation protein YlmC with PRC-barrel domain
MTTESGATTAEDLTTSDNVVGASVGGFFARDNYSNDELIAATKVTNAKVYNKDGDKIGWLDEVVLNKHTGQVEYVVLAVGGFLGIGERYHPLPWSMLRYDVELSGYVVDIDRDQLEGAPSYAATEEVDWADRQWGQRLSDYYGVRPYWAEIA